MEGFVKFVRDDGVVEYRHPDYESLLVHPTVSEDQIVHISAEDLQKYELTEYQRDRALAYPSIADQLDTLYHGGYDAWKAQVQAVKNQFPKPPNI